MNLFKQTTLIGIGLIGSSIARALKEKRLSKKICIFSRTKKTINKAKKLKLGNFYTNDLEKSVKNSDLIIICTPLSTYKTILERISDSIMPGAILSDVGSVKSNVVKIFSKIQNKNFPIKSKPLFRLYPNWLVAKSCSSLSLPIRIEFSLEDEKDIWSKSGTPIVFLCIHLLNRGPICLFVSFGSEHFL